MWQRTILPVLPATSCTTPAPVINRHLSSKMRALSLILSSKGTNPPKTICSFSYCIRMHVAQPAQFSGKRGKWRVACKEAESTWRQPSLQQTFGGSDLPEDKIYHAIFHLAQQR